MDAGDCRRTLKITGRRSDARNQLATLPPLRLILLVMRRFGVDAMPESAQDKYSRVQQMLLDDGETWDLSPNDKEALRHVLGLVNILADEVAKYEGGTVPGVMKKFAAIVEGGE